jgi:hypothetical protein
MARRDPVFSNRDGGSGNELFAAVAYLAAGIAVVLVLVAAVGRQPASGVSDVETPDPAPRIRALLEDRSRVLVEWRTALRQICESPDLQAEEMAANCETGAIVIGDELFEDSTSPQLTEEGMRKLQLVIPIVLSALRSRDLVWDNLESIELRGHADPRARQDPYITNLVGSQKRPLGVMLYLVSEWALADRDRKDLERLIVISGSSYSRPPPACPERTRACYPYWRRVEILPTMRSAQLRHDMTNMLDRVDALLPEEPHGG